MDLPSIAGAVAARNKASITSAIKTQSAFVLPLESLGAVPRSSDETTEGTSLLDACPGP